jgi:hypothetical protein
MRVEVREPGPGEEGSPPGRRGFDRALERARRAGDAADRGRVRASALDRRDAIDRADRLLRERRAGFEDRERAGSSERAGARTERSAAPAPRGPHASPAAPADPAAGFAPGVHAPSLRAAIRALPVAAEAARGGETLELAFGRALSVELRAARDGVEIVLRPDAGLFRQAAEELPALLRALRDRGVAVVRAEVRRAAPRVDGPAGLR